MSFTGIRIRFVARALCAAALLLPGAGALAWVYPEHRDIAVLMVNSLDPERRAAFDRFWAQARRGHESRLCEPGAVSGQGLAPSCIDWAAMAAIAGDHSCSSNDMVDVVTRADWILLVADVGAQLKVDLSRVPVVPPPGMQSLLDKTLPEIRDLRRRVQSQELRAERMNALKTSDTRLQRVDPAYATRADANSAHFLYPRPRVDTDISAYGALTAVEGAELNAVGVYGSFHLSALQKATRLAHESLTPDERQALTLAMLADEAFAQHFLQDTFAAGHVAGSWGDASQRKGTHDHYNENGLEVVTWGGGRSPTVLMGDAHMRPEDASASAQATRRSLEQVLDAATGKMPEGLRHTPAAPMAPESLDVCKLKVFPARAAGMHLTPELLPLFGTVLAAAPMPGLGAGLGSLPRFRSELGTFIGLAGTLDGRVLNGGFADGQRARGSVVGLDLSFMAGLGLDGVLGEAGDGLVFASIGLRADSASSNKFSTDAGDAGAITAAVPARTALTMRFRMPFYLVPGDLLLMSPLYLLDPKAYTAMAVTASNGGLIPWQQGWATRMGRFQFVLGRELGVTFYGHSSPDKLLTPSPSGDGSLQLVGLKSTYFDLPILEYRPYRSFSGHQSSDVKFQLFAGADVPRYSDVISPTGQPPMHFRTVWSLGLRLVFDWRLYN